MQEGFDVIHGPHGTGKPQYTDQKAKGLYESSDKPYKKTDLSIDGSPLQHSYILRGDVSSPVVGVASLGEMLRIFMKTKESGVKRGDWKSKEPRVIEYVLKNFGKVYKVDRLFVNHHSAEILNEEYVKGLEDGNFLALWKRFGNGKMTTFSFIHPYEEKDIRLRLKLEEENEQDRFPKGIDTDINEKLKHSKRMFKLIPGEDKIFKVVVSYLQPEYELRHDLYKRLGIEPHIFHDEDAPFVFDGKTITFIMDQDAEKGGNTSLIRLPRVDSSR